MAKDPGTGYKVFVPKTAAAYGRQKRSSPLIGPPAPGAYVPQKVTPRSVVVRPQAAPDPHVTQASPATPALDALIVGQPRANAINSRRADLTQNIDQRQQVTQIQNHLKQL